MERVREREKSSFTVILMTTPPPSSCAELTLSPLFLQGGLSTSFFLRGQRVEEFHVVVLGLLLTRIFAKNQLSNGAAGFVMLRTVNNILKTMFSCFPPFPHFRVYCILPLPPSTFFALSRIWEIGFLRPAPRPPQSNRRQFPRTGKRENAKWVAKKPANFLFLPYLCQTT